MHGRIQLPFMLLQNVVELPLKRTSNAGHRKLVPLLTDTQRHIVPQLKGCPNLAH